MVGATILGMINQGTSSIFSIFLTDIAEGIHVSIGTLMYAVTVTTVFAVIGSLLLGTIVEKIGVRKCLILASIMTPMGLLIISFAQNIAVVFVACALSGIQLAIGTTATLSILVNEWFVKKRSQMTGIVLGGTLFGCVVMMFVASRLQVIFQNWRTCDRVIAVTVLIIGLLVNLFLIRMPEDLRQKPLGWEEAVKETEEQIGEITGISDKQALRSFSFVAMLIAGIGFSMACECVNSYGPTFFVTYGMDALTASNMAMIFVLVASVSGIVSGGIAEKFGNKVYVAFLSVALIVGLGMLSYWPATSEIKLLIAAVAIVGLGAPASSNIAPTVSLEVFGKKAYNTTSSVLVGAGYAGCAMSALLMNVAMAWTGEMKTAYSIGAVLVIVGLVLTILAIVASPNRKRMKG